MKNVCIKISELAKAQSKKDKRELCQRYGLTLKKFTSLVESYNQGKFKSDYIRVGVEDEQADSLPQTMSSKDLNKVMQEKKKNMVKASSENNLKDERSWFCKFQIFNVKLEFGGPGKFPPVLQGALVLFVISLCKKLLGNGSEKTKSIPVGETVE